MRSHEFAHRSKFVDLVLTTRPHQWVKNLLILLPVFAAHRGLDLSVLIPSLVALLAMIVASSAVYAFNDLLDASADRAHSTKRERPIARGAVTKQDAIALIVVLILLLLAIVALLPVAFAGWIAVYVTTTTAYSLRLKRYAVVDVLTLAGMYTLRIMAGGAASGLVISPWLLALSMFFFFSLALLKRYVELAGWTDDDAAAGSGRGYTRMDLPMLYTFGIASGFLCVLVLALYITSGDAVVLYSSATWLWILCVLLLYWICHIWLSANRGDVHDDPVWFAISDRASLIVMALVIGVLIMAS